MTITYSECVCSLRYCLSDFREIRFNGSFQKGHAVVQLVKALRYNPEARGFDSRLGHWNFSLTQSFRPHYAPGVDSACNRNEYQENIKGLG